MKRCQRWYPPSGRALYRPIRQPPGQIWPWGVCASDRTKMPISSGCKPSPIRSLSQTATAFDFSFRVVKGFNSWSGSVEDRDGPAAGLGDAIDIGDFGTQQFVGLHADLVGGAVIDAQGFGAATHIHAQRLPGEGLLEDALTQVSGKEQAIGTVVSGQGRQQFELRDADILGFVHHDEIKGRTLTGGIMRSQLVEHACICDQPLFFERRLYLSRRSTTRSCRRLSGRRVLRPRRATSR